MSGKKCDKCEGPFKGFGTTCSACRKGGKIGGQARDCDKCGIYFVGFGAVCQDCINGKGLGRTGVKLPTEGEVDQCLDRIDTCIQKVDLSQQSMVKLRKAEFDLLAQLEIVRDIMQRILKSGDRQLLRSTFVDCGRVARLSAFLDSIHLSDMNASDKRMKDCQGVLDSLKEMMGNDLGMEKELQEAEESAQSGLLMKRLDVVMDKEKVAQAKGQAEALPEASAPPPITGEYASVYVSAHSGSYTRSYSAGYLDGGYSAGGYGGYGGGYGGGHGGYGYYAYGVGGGYGYGAGDYMEDDGVEDYSDWDDEDMEELSDEQAEQLFKSNAWALFEELDVNKDGQLSRDEVMNACPSLSSLLKACKIHKRKHVIKMFKEGDIDASGTLDFDEFIQYLQAARTKSISAQPKLVDDTKAKRIFELMDRDGDGSLTSVELKLAYAGVLLMVGEPVDPDRIEKWVDRNFKRYDKDDSGTLDLAEFKSLLSHSGALAPLLDFVADACGDF